MPHPSCVVRDMFPPSPRLRSVLLGGQGIGPGTVVEVGFFPARVRRDRSCALPCLVRHATVRKTAQQTSHDADVRNLDGNDLGFGWNDYG